MPSLRITVSASAEDLDTLAAEAERRGVPLTVILGEAIVEKAASLRQARRPRLGTGAGGGHSDGARVMTGESVAHEPS